MTESINIKTIEEEFFEAFGIKLTAIIDDFTIVYMNNKKYTSHQYFGAKYMNISQEEFMQIKLDNPDIFGVIKSLRKQVDELNSKNTTLYSKLCEANTRAVTKVLEIQNELETYKSKNQIAIEGLEKIMDACQYEENCKECHLDRNTCLCLIAKETIERIKND